jgi:hypothetical protein
MAESLFSNIGGTIQAAVAGQIGFVDDLSRVKTYGPNLANNPWLNNHTSSFPTFASTGPEGFTASTTGAQSDIRVRVGVSGGFVAGKVYEFEVTTTISGATVSAVSASVTGNSSSFATGAVIPAGAAVTTKVTFVPTLALNAVLLFFVATEAATVAVSGVLIREFTSSYLPMTQANANLRPLRGRRPKTGARNLYTSTADLSAGAWVKGNTTVGVVAGPGGAAGAWRITADAGTNKKLIRRTTVDTAGLAVVQSFVVKAGTHAFVQVMCSGDAQAFANFNLTTGAVGTFGTKTTASIVALGDGWYRCIAAYNSTHVLGSGSYRLYLVSSASAAFDSDLAATGTETVDVFAPQVELGTVATPYQLVGATNHDITEEGVESISQVDFDYLDDTLVSPAIAAGLTGQAFVAGDGGMFVSDLTIAAAGTFTIGTASNNWTGATPGILRAVGGLNGRVLDWGIRAGNFTEAEIGRLEAFYRAQGGKALLVETGGNLITLATMTGGAEWTFGGGVWTKPAGVGSSLSASISFVAGAFYRMVVTATRTAGNLTPQITGGTTLSAAVINTSGTFTHLFVSAAGNNTFGLTAGSTFDGTVTAVSLTRLIPRGEL